MWLRHARLSIHHLEFHTAHMSSDMIATDGKPKIQNAVLISSTLVVRVRNMIPSRQSGPPYLLTEISSEPPPGQMD